MNLACAGSAFGSLHGRGTSVSRVQSSCFFLRGSCRPGKCRQGYTARQRPRFCSQAWPCIHLQSPSFSRRAHTFRFETRSFRATERTIDPGHGFATTGLVLKTSGWWRPRGRGTRGRAAQTGSIRQEFTTNRARKKAPRGPGRGGRQRRLRRARGPGPGRCRAPFRPRLRMRRAADRAHAARPRRGGVCGATEPRADDRPSIGHSGA